MSYQIEIRLLGEHLTPEKISSRDIGELISSIEQMIAAIVARDNPALGLDESEVTVGLASVQRGSYILQFETPYETATQKAYNTVTDSINQNNYKNLPSKTVDAIKSVRKITRKYKTDTQFWERNGSHTQLATVSPKTEIQVDRSYISGKTTLYGFVVGVIGDNRPRVRLRLLTGDIQICSITKENNLKVAKQLGQRLYTNVGVRGTARWDIGDMSMQEFHVESVTGYKKANVENALDTLYEIAGDDYELVDDIGLLVAESRGYDEEF